MAFWRGRAERMQRDSIFGSTMKGPLDRKRVEIIGINKDEHKQGEEKVGAVKR